MIDSLVTSFTIGIDFDRTVETIAIEFETMDVSVSPGELIEPNIFLLCAIALGGDPDSLSFDDNPEPKTGVLSPSEDFSRFFFLGISYSSVPNIQDFPIRRNKNFD